ncbi:tweety-related [Anaeramoeba flamelloides]|uniref:Tweety-related n=1 Tax=Anaeramoeba flamelloides TaxID=1746091 RepID=A0ABQ8XVB0_9EUKA|nr:tweety-related [Anaeramoeba flamelloides]
MKILLILLLLAFTNFCTCELYSEYELKIPRYDLKGNRIDDRFCSVSEDNECQWSQYYQFLGILSALGVILAVVCILLIFVFSLMKAFQNCSFCQRKEVRAHGKKKIQKYRISSIGVFIILLFSIYLAYFYNYNITDSVSDIFGSVIDTETNLLTQANDIKEKLEKWNDTITVDMDNTVKQVEILKDSSVDTKETIEKFNGYRSYGTYIIFIVSSVIFSISFSLAIFWKKSKIAAIIAIIVLIFCSILWFFTSVHFTVAFVINDICFELSEDNLNAENSPIREGYLDKIMNCSGSEIFQDFNNAIDEASAEVTEKMCGGVTEFCSQKSNMTENNYNCTHDPQTCDSTNYDLWTEEEVPDFVSGCWQPLQPFKIQECFEESTECEQMGNNYTYTVDQCMVMKTLTECSESCTNEDEKSGTSDFLEGVDDFADFNSLLVDIKNAVNCSTIVSTWEKVTNSLCTGVGTSMRNISGASALSSLCIFIGTLTILIGEKKFAKKKVKNDSSSDDESDVSLDTFSNSEEFSSSQFGTLVKYDNFDSIKNLPKANGASEWIAEHPDKIGKAVHVEDLEETSSD